MKTLLLCIMLLLSGVLTAQTVDNPSFKARSGSLFNITRIERTPETTKLFIHAIFRPHWWIKVDGNNYLQDAATGIKYPFEKAEGIELNKEVYMPDSGEMDFIMYFAPLPKETTVIHWFSPNGSESNTYDISLVAPKDKKTFSFNSIKGNWYNADTPGKWEYGIYDSISIIQNRIFINMSIRTKGKHIEMTMKDKKSGHTTTLLLTPKKDGNLQIQHNGAEKQIYTKQKSTGHFVMPGPDFNQFFRKDTACLQGFIDGYDPRLDFETGMIYLNNILSREDYPTVANIYPDGSFEAKFILYHPVESNLLLNNTWIPFYIEPGQTVTMYIDWEAILARSRARDYNFPINNTEYMGALATISEMYRSLDGLIDYPYEQLTKSKKELTPEQFKEKIQTVFSGWDLLGDSLAQIYKTSGKATHLLKNKIAVEKGRIYFDFLASRDYYAEEDTTNQVLKVKEEESYYDFLKNIPLDDETLLADSRCDVFINRFEFMAPLRKILYRIDSQDSIPFTYPSKPLLSFLKEKGVKLTPEQEQLRLSDEKLAGRAVKIDIKEAMRRHNIIADLYQSEQDLINEHTEKYISPALDKDSKVSDEEADRKRMAKAKEYRIEGDSIINLLSNRTHSFIWQTFFTRSLNFDLNTYSTTNGAQKYADDLSTYLTHPILVTEARRISEEVLQKKSAVGYQLPDSKATMIFRNIIKAHQGKVLFVDFWAISCGPCRAGIEATAQLRKQYKDHPEFQFIYITSQKESPENTYNAYVEKNLKGEASYRVSETEFNHLRELFKFNGIPHYELIEKDGSVSPSPGTHELKEYLTKRFGEPAR